MPIKKPYTNYYLIKISDLNRASKSEQIQIFFYLKRVNGVLVMFCSLKGLEKNV